MEQDPSWSAEGEGLEKEQNPESSGLSAKGEDNDPSALSTEVETNDPSALSTEVDPDEGFFSNPSN